MSMYAQLYRMYTVVCLEQPLVGGRGGRLLWLGHGASRELPGLWFISDFTSLSHPSCQSLIAKSFTHIHPGFSLSLVLFLSVLEHIQSRTEEEEFNQVV